MSEYLVKHPFRDRATGQIVSPGAVIERQDVPHRLIECGVLVPYRGKTEPLSHKQITPESSQTEDSEKEESDQEENSENQSDDEKDGSTDSDSEHVKPARGRRSRRRN